MTATGLTADTVYQFKVRATNVVGDSDFGTSISVRAAAVPATISTPETAISGDNVIVTWATPYNGGSPLTRYTITIKNADGVTFTEDTTNCNGADSTILADATCTIPISALNGAPLSLPWGSSIWVKVTSTNIVGVSISSVEGNNAIILTNPDPPINVVNLPLVTHSSQIGLSWGDDTENGGTPIIDYRVWYGQGEVPSSYVILASNVVGQTYTSTGLIADTIYTFKLQARNNFGYSTVYSTPVSILAAKVSTVPLSLANDDTMTGATTIKITWTAPSDNGGTPVIDYRVNYKVSTDSSWIILSDGITTLYYTANSLTSDLIYDWKVEARNLVGFSGYSDIVSIRAAAVPAQPNVPVSTVVGQNVQITWDIPMNNGSPITAYQIVIKNQNGQFTEETANCDGSDTTIRDA